MLTTLTPFAHFFDDVKNKREVLKKRKIDKTTKIDRRGYIFWNPEIEVSKTYCFLMILCCILAVGGQFWSYVNERLKKVCKPSRRQGGSQIVPVLGFDFGVLSLFIHLELKI